MDRAAENRLHRFSSERSPDLGERIGEALGILAGPLFAATSTLRRARTFHPRGDCADATVVAAPDVSERFAPLARRLEGKAFVRFADALTKKKARWPDVLGCAIRFGTETSLEDGDQDLLFATIKRPWTMPFSPFSTRVSDWLANDYFAVSPFEVLGQSHLYFRLRPVVRGEHDVATGERSAKVRRSRLERAAFERTAVLAVEVASSPRGPFEPVVHVRLMALREDPPALHFDPFRSGLGIEPRGFVHALRRGVYAASQRARDRVGPPRTAVFGPG